MSDIDGTLVLRARGLGREYGRDPGLVRAVERVELDVAPGETVAVMSPSGCGKSTLAHQPAVVLADEPMRGAFIDETMLTGGAGGNLAELAGLGG